MKKFKCIFYCKKNNAFNKNIQIWFLLRRKLCLYEKYLNMEENNEF